MNPNQIIAALLDIASAAFALQHDPEQAADGRWLVNKDDLGTIHERLWRLDQLPQPAGKPPMTPTAKARHYMQDFLVGEAIKTMRERTTMSPLDIETVKRGVEQMSTLPLEAAQLQPPLREFDWFDFLGYRAKMLDIFHDEGQSDAEIAHTMSMSATQVMMIRARNRAIDLVRSPHQPVREVVRADDRATAPVLDLETIMRDFEKTPALQPLTEKSLIGRVLIDAYRRQHPEAGDLSYSQIVEAIVNLIDEKPATYADAYVEALQRAVADLAMDGRRFRTLMGLFDTVHAEVPDMKWVPALERMEKLGPTTEDEFRVALDTLVRENLVPESDALIDSAMAAEKLRQQALALAGAVVNKHRLVYASGGSDCMYCGARLDGDEFDAAHRGDCPVNLAKQIIEDQQ